MIAIVPGQLRRTPGPSRPADRLFAGLRSDPFFADVEGALHGSSGPGTTTSPTTTSTRSAWKSRRHARRGRHRRLGSISRYQAASWSNWTAAGTRPSTVHQPDGEEPVQLPPAADDVATNWAVVTILENAGGYTRAGQAAALEVLPTSCTTTGPSRHLPQRRVTTDDVYSMRFAADNGKVPPLASSRTTTCWPNSPTSVRPTPRRAVPDLNRCVGRLAGQTEASTIPLEPKPFDLERASALWCP